MKRLTQFAIGLAVAGLGMFLPSTSAQVGSCPNDGSGEAIQCRLGNLLNKNETFLNTVQTKFGSCTDQSAHCSAMKNHLKRAQDAHTRAKAAHGRANADNYHQLTVHPKYKRNSKKGNGNSVMAVAAVGGTSQDMVDSDYDPEIGQTITDSLDDATAALDEATHLADTPEPTPPTWADINEYDFKRDENYPGWLHPTIDEKVWIPALFSIKLAGKALEFAHTAAEHACNETLVFLGEGGNVSAACTPLALAVVAFNSTAEMMEFADNDILYWTAKGGYENAKLSVKSGNASGKIIAEAAGDIGAVKAKVDAIAEYVDTHLNPDMIEVKASLKLLHEEVLTNQALIKEALKLMLIPEGKRTLDPGITTCVGNKCPNVLYKCGVAVCSFPF